jgi:hypothetical protein
MLAWASGEAFFVQAIGPTGAPELLLPERLQPAAAKVEAARSRLAQPLARQADAGRGE